MLNQRQAKHAHIGFFPHRRQSRFQFRRERCLVGRPRGIAVEVGHDQRVPAAVAHENIARQRMLLRPAPQRRHVTGVNIRPALRQQVHPFHLRQRETSRDYRPNAVEYTGGVGDGHHVGGGGGDIRSRGGAAGNGPERVIYLLQQSNAFRRTHFPAVHAHHDGRLLADDGLQRGVPLGIALIARQQVVHLRIHAHARVQGHETSPPGQGHGDQHGATGIPQKQVGTGNRHGPLVPPCHGWGNKIFSAASPDRVSKIDYFPLLNNCRTAAVMAVTPVWMQLVSGANFAECSDGNGSPCACARLRAAGDTAPRRNI